MEAPLMRLGIPSALIKKLLMISNSKSNSEWEQWLPQADKPGKGEGDRRRETYISLNTI